jgi:hypothetical protein
MYLRFVILMTLSVIISLVGTVAHAKPQSATVTYTLVEAFYQNRQVYYYTFDNGTPILDEGRSVGVALQYRLVDESGQPVPAQLDIISANAHQEGYSDLREIVEVTVPADYEANTITDTETLLAQDWPQNPTGKTRNIPIVRADSQLQGRDRELIELWWNGEIVHAFDFGENPAFTAPIYVLIEGIAPDGNPVRITHNALIEQMHDDEGYSDFWQVVLVTVPADLEPNSIRSVQALRDAGYPMEVTANVVNCPALRLEQLAVAYLNDVPYNITHIPHLDMEAVEGHPPLYIYALDDGIPDFTAPIVLSRGEFDEGYTGFCEPTQVYLAGSYVTSEADLLADNNIRLVPQGYLSTCAILSEVLPPPDNAPSGG